ncbi:MAG: hypothetical protein IJO48_04845 [Clostridia bacterium]|nr:hypothetical protein [Clostridia bacterium]
MRGSNCVSNSDLSWANGHAVGIVPPCKTSLKRTCLLSESGSAIAFGDMCGECVEVIAEQF